MRAVDLQVGSARALSPLNLSPMFIRSVDQTVRAPAIVDTQEQLAGAPAAGCTEALHKIAGRSS